MEHKPEKTLLNTPGQDPISYVQERWVSHLTVGIEDPYDSYALRYEQSIVTRRSRDDGRLTEPFEDRLELHALQRRKAGYRFG
jgi:hypothetical protein